MENQMKIIFDMVEAQRNRIEELEFQATEFKENYLKVINQKCPSDERHCGCVPLLYMRIASLENYIKDMEVRK